MVRLSVRPWNSTVEEFDGRIPREAARVEVPWWMKNLRPRFRQMFYRLIIIKESEFEGQLSSLNKSPTLILFPSNVEEV